MYTEPQVQTAAAAIPQVGVNLIQGYNLIGSLILICIMNICTQTIVSKTVKGNDKNIVNICAKSLIIMTAISVFQFMSIVFQYMEHKYTGNLPSDFAFIFRNLCIFYMPFILLLLSRRIKQIVLVIPIYIEAVSIIASIIINNMDKSFISFTILILILSTAVTLNALIRYKQIMQNWHCDIDSTIPLLSLVKEFIIGFMGGGIIAAWVALLSGTNNDLVMLISAISIIVCSVLFYLLPTIVAVRRQHLQKVPIILVNILLGWSLIGWIVALVWAFMKSKPKVVHIHNENSNDINLSGKLKELEELRQGGLITSEEFENKKSELLKKY